ncbi:MAG: hypothetical protein ACXVZX_08955 [Terriglobales bacterium]
MMCHLASSNPGELVKVKQTGDRISPVVCFSCHDGQIAEEPNLPLHLAHAGRQNRPGLKCIDCHDPHDRSHSFRLLRGKRGPQNAQTAALDFCRDCHPDH